MAPTTIGEPEARGRVTGSVAMPRSHTGVRSWRRERMKRQRRQRRLAAAGIFLAVVAAALLLVMEDPAGNRPSPATAPSGPARAVGPLPALFVVQDDSGTVQAIVLLSPLPSGKGGSVIVIPPDTLTQIVPGGSQAVKTALVSTPAAPGDVKMIDTVENMLGVSIGSIAVAGYSQLASLLSPVGPLHVQLQSSIAPAEGSQGESFGPGNVAVAPGQVGDFVGDVGPGGPTEKVERLGNLVQAWIGALRSAPAAAPQAGSGQAAALSSTSPSSSSGAPLSSTSPSSSSGAPLSSTSPSSSSGAPSSSTSPSSSSGAPSSSTSPSSSSGAPSSSTSVPASAVTVPPVSGAASLGRSLVALSRGATTVAMLPVEEIPAESPGAPVEYQLNTKALLASLPDLFPGQPGALVPRPKIQLLNGTGGLGLNEEAMSALEPWVDVTLSGNACTPQSTSAQFSCFGYAKTEIITYDARGRSDATRIARLLGTGEILRSAGSSDIVDATVIVGADFHVSG